jgi:hypothetical protein
MAKVRRSMGERSRRWHHVTESLEDLLAGIRALRESAEEPRELSAEIQQLGNPASGPATPVTRPAGSGLEPAGFDA